MFVCQIINIACVCALFRICWHICVCVCVCVCVGPVVIYRCSSVDGQCPCRPNMVGLSCSNPAPGHYLAPLDYYIYEAEDAAPLDRSSPVDAAPPDSSDPEDAAPPDRSSSEDAGPPDSSGPEDAAPPDSSSLVRRHHLRYQSNYQHCFHRIDDIRIIEAAVRSFRMKHTCLVNINNSAVSIDKRVSRLSNECIFGNTFGDIVLLKHLHFFTLFARFRAMVFHMIICYRN